MRRAWTITKNVLVWCIAAIAIGMMIFTLISVNTFNRNDRTIFGYKAFVVLSDSMSATDFTAGDLIFVKEVEPSTLTEGDIIAYIAQGKENHGKTVTHKIRKCTVDEQGNPGFITYGTTTGIDDDHVVTYPYVLGKYQRRLPAVGKFFLFLKTVPGYLIFVLAPFMVLIVRQGIRCAKIMRKYRNEQLADLKAEREQLEKELIELKERLERESFGIEEQYENK